MKRYVLSEKATRTALSSNCFHGIQDYFFKKLQIYKSIELKIYVDLSEDFFYYRVEDGSIGFPYAPFYNDFGVNRIVDICNKVADEEMNKLIKSNIIKEKI